MITDVEDSVSGAAPTEHQLAEPLSRSRFRPDIEGLRAIAVGLVVAFHGFGAPFAGGFVGVDVFFVISGFLITTLLLREKTNTGRISILAFYARRVRRILPASALVVVLTIIASYQFLGFFTGNATSEAAKWTAVFAANVHFGITGTDYFGAATAPSPLLHMWSLGVEEQFYLVWPGIFLMLVLLVRGARHRVALAVTLAVVIASSFAWSVIQTASNPTWAYFSPLTRAWELGLGALVAVAAPALARISTRWVLELLAVVGIVGIVASGLRLNESVPYPGSAVAWPVVATALVIAVGCANERTLTGRILSVWPLQWVGARSYSLYLWHWPILIIAMQYEVVELTTPQRAGLVAAAVVASALTYWLVENPVRRAAFLAKHTGYTLLVGAILILGTLAVAQTLIANNGGTWDPFQSTDTAPALDY